MTPAEEDVPSLRLVSFDLCPFVQRSAIALEEKGIDYDMVYIDLRNKPDWLRVLRLRGNDRDERGSALENAGLS